jgi:hypothetical protein
MDRHDLYTTVHKAIRALLFDGARLVARTDFALPEQAAAARAALERLMATLDEHAEHEDEFILPELERINPELHADLRSDHARVHGMQDEIRGLAARLATASAVERVALGRRIHDRMGALVAEHLRHLEREECQVNRMLWAHRTDAELREVEGRLLASIPPPRLVEWLGWILPAANLSERAGMLRDMRAGMPPEVFEPLTAQARAALGAAAWSEALRAAEALQAPAGSRS